jgi:hypothetical protein
MRRPMHFLLVEDSPGDVRLTTEAVGTVADQEIARAYALQSNCCVAKPLGASDFVRPVRAFEGSWFDAAALPASSAHGR